MSTPKEAAGEAAMQEVVAAIRAGGGRRHPHPPRTTTRPDRSGHLSPRRAMPICDPWSSNSPRPGSTARPPTSISTPGARCPARSSPTAIPTTRAPATAPISPPPAPRRSSATASATSGCKPLNTAKNAQIGGAKISFHPAGHVPGSAQIRVEVGGEVWVVSGDYKTVDDGLSTPFEPVRCHTFISESTFGLPIYTWTPQDILAEELNTWWAEPPPRQTRRSSASTRSARRSASCRCWTRPSARS
jgi:hypothetical protein